jgi:hypothetical protein
MLQRRYSQCSTLAISHLVRPKLPTGKGFGYSNFQLVRLPELVSPIANDATICETASEPIGVEESSPLIVKVGQIALLVFWLWCSIGANFCLESINAIATYSAKDL